MKHQMINQQEHEYLTEFFKVDHTQLSVNEQKELLQIYQRTVNKNYTISNCGKCWVNLISVLKRMYNETK